MNTIVKNTVNSFFNESFDFGKLNNSKKQLINNAVKLVSVKVAYEEIKNTIWNAFTKNGLKLVNEGIDFEVINIKNLDNDKKEYVIDIKTNGKEVFEIYFDSILEYYMKNNILMDYNNFELPLYINNVDADVKFITFTYSENCKIKDWKTFPRTINGNFDVIYSISGQMVEITDFLNFCKTIKGHLYIDCNVVGNLLNLRESKFNEIILESYHNNNFEGLENKNFTETVKLKGTFNSLKGLPVFNNIKWLYINGNTLLNNYEGLIVKQADKIYLNSNNNFEGCILGNIKYAELHGRKTLKGLTVTEEITTLDALPGGDFTSDHYNIFEGTNIKKIKILNIEKGRINNFNGLENTEIEQIKLLGYSGNSQTYSLEGLPEKVQLLNLLNLNYLVDLKGLPTYIDKLICIKCEKLQTLEGMENSVINNFTCNSNNELTDIHNIGKIKEKFNINNCKKINDDNILDIVDKIEGDICCTANMNFTKDTIEKIDKHNNSYSNFANRTPTYNEAILYFVKTYNVYLNNTSKYDDYINETFEDNYNEFGNLHLCPTFTISYNHEYEQPFNKLNGDLIYQLDADILGTPGYDIPASYWEPASSVDADVTFDNASCLLYYYSEDYNDFIMIEPDENNDIKISEDDLELIKETLKSIQDALEDDLEKDIDNDPDDYAEGYLNENGNNKIITNTIRQYYNINEAFDFNKINNSKKKF